jgi:4-amino-4-deoxy-L-arabinose transferase-like glycosyltransferase
MTAAALGAIVIGATVLRFADLGSNPGGLYPDEAAEGLDAQRLLHVAGFHPVFFPDGGGREALFGYLVAAVFRLAGETVLALRATAAGIGVLAVVAIWLLGRRFGTWAGLAAAAWAAGSLWLVSVSRDGMRNMLVPLLGALALAALLYWLDRPSRRTAVLAGAVTSIAAVYTYQPLKLLPVLVLVWLFWLHRVDRPTYGRLRVGVPAFVVAFLIVAAPMIGAAFADPSNYFGRMAAVTPFNPDVQADSGLLVHWVRTLAMFALVGDPNARHDVAALPLLGWPLFLAASLGLVRLWRRRRDAAHALVLWSLPLFLMPPLVAIEGDSPHFLRALGLAAPLAVTIGLGFVELVGLARVRWGPSAGRLAAVASAVGLVVLAIGSGTAYLSRPVADRYEAFTYDLVVMADVARETPHAAVVLDDYSATVVRFLDFPAPPTVIPPGVRLGDPGTYSQVIARAQGDLVRALGSTVADRAVPVARDPAGNPTVWSVAP